MSKTLYCERFYNKDRQKWKNLNKGFAPACLSEILDLNLEEVFILIKKMMLACKYMGIEGKVVILVMNVIIECYFAAKNF